MSERVDELCVSGARDTARAFAWVRRRWSARPWRNEAKVPPLSAPISAPLSMPMSAPNFCPADPTEAACLAALLDQLDGALATVPKAWSAGSLLSKVNPARLETLFAALESRDSRTLADLIVEISTPASAVSPIAIITKTNNALRESFVRGVMQALMQAVADVELAYQPGTVSAAALIERLRIWVADPRWSQPAGERTAVPTALAVANDVLQLITSDLMGGPGGSTGAAALSAAEGPAVRVGVVAPLAMGLRLAAVMQETPREVLDLAIAGFERARAETRQFDAHTRASSKD